MTSNASITSNTFHATVPDIRPGMNYDTRPAIPISRTKRTRAKRSCDLCRKKKTRCDANVNKPCTSCANVNTECEFLVEQKKRGPATGFSTKKNGYVEALENRLKRMEALMESMASEKATAFNSENVPYYYNNDNTTVPAEPIDLVCPTSEDDLPPQITDVSNTIGNFNEDCTITGSAQTIMDHPMMSETETTLHSRTATTISNAHTSSNNSATTSAAFVNAKTGTEDPWLIENTPIRSPHNNNLSCNDIMNATSELTSKMEKITIADYERTRYIGMSSGVHLLHQGLFSSNKRHPIKEMPSWFVQKVNDDEEEHILIKSEALKTPPQNCLDRTSVFTTAIPHMNQDRIDLIIQTYFTTYHPVCPVVNKMSFLEQYYYQDPSPCDEYLLCAICSIGARTISMLDKSTLPSCILELTEDELLEMENAFRDKACSIFDLVYKRSQISSVQTLILFTLFAETPESDSDDTSYWFKTGMTIRMAQDLGLHRSATGWHIPESEMELRRRIWYVTYLMDRWVAAELGRPITIIDQDFDVELPSQYEVKSCHQKDFSERPFVPDIILQTELDIRNKTPIYSQFHHSIFLGQIFGQVLSGLHSPRSIRSGRQSHSLVHILDTRLKDWKNNVPSALLYDTDDPKCISSNSGFIFLEYNCVLLLLYRPFITNKESEDVTLAFRALNACTVAANNILSLAENMGPFTLACIPWTISVYSIFQAAIIFLHNAKGNNTYVAEQGAKNLLRCAQVIRSDKCLSSSRIAIVLESIAASYSVNLDEEMSPVDETTGTIQHRRRKRTDSTPLVPTTLSMNQDKKNDNSNNYGTDDLEKRDHLHAAKHAKSDLTPSANLEKDLLAFPSHYLSTRPEDMFLSSLSRGSTASTSSSSPPLVSIGARNPDPPTTYSQHQQHQQKHQYSNHQQQQYMQQQQQLEQEQGQCYQQEQSENQLPLDPLPSFLISDRWAEQKQHQPQQQVIDVNSLLWHPSPVGTAVRIPDPLNDIQQHHQQVWPADHTHPLPELATSTQQQNPQAFFDLTCLSSEVPLNSMPNSVLWEDWDMFLKTNISQ